MIDNDDDDGALAIEAKWHRPPTLLKNVHIKK